MGGSSVLFNEKIFPAIIEAVGIDVVNKEGGEWANQ
jgi:hypothetical protein